MLDPKDARFRDCWEDGIAPRWKDAPDDPQYGFGKDRTRFRVRGMTFIGQAGLHDVYVGLMGNNGNGINLVEQASDGFVIGRGWTSLAHLSELHREGKLPMDYIGQAWLFFDVMCRFAHIKDGLPARPDPMPQEILALRMCRMVNGAQQAAHEANVALIRSGLKSVATAMAQSARPKEAFVPASPSVVAHYGIHDGGRNLKFVGRCGPLDVWLDQTIVGDDSIHLVAVSSPGVETTYRHDLFCDGACASADAPPWVQPVVNWLVRTKDDLPARYACRAGKHEWSHGPVDHDAHRVCKLCGARKGDGEEKASGRAEDGADADLVAALKESEWYGRFAEATHDTWPDSMRHLHACVCDRRTAKDGSYPEKEQPLIREMLAIIDEITSGRIYGSKERCAICGHDPLGYNMRDRDRSFHCCSACARAVTTGQSAAMDILRARRELGEKRSGTYEDRSGHGDDLTTKPGNPLPCAGCGKPSTRPLGALRVCDQCGDLLLWSRAGGKVELLEKLAATHAEAMAAEFRDPHMRHGLVEWALRMYAGRPGYGVDPVPIGSSDEEVVAARQRQRAAENRLVDAMIAERREEASWRRNRSRVRTDDECRAVRERMIREQVPAWLDPRRK